MHEHNPDKSGRVKCHDILNYVDLSLPYLTIPAGWMPAVNRYPAMRPQHRPNAQPRQTSRLIEPLGSFDKLQRKTNGYYSKYLAKEYSLQECCVLPKKH